MSQKNKKIMARFIDEAWNKKNPAILEELLAKDFLHYMPGSKEPMKGAAAYQQSMDVFNKAFPKNRMEVVADFGEGKRVCVQWIFHGTHKGPFAGVEPKGAKVKLSGVVVARVRKGKIEEMVSVFDTAELHAMMSAAPKAAPKKK
jgi:steroid delta-isomerase-like uncharacterized protein